MTMKFLLVMTIWQQWRWWRWSWWCAYRRRWESVIQNLCFPSPIHQPHKVPSASMARECGAPFTSKLQMQYKLLISKAISYFVLKHSVEIKGGRGIWRCPKNHPIEKGIFPFATDMILKKMGLRKNVDETFLYTKCTWLGDCELPRAMTQQSGSKPTLKQMHPSPPAISS